jgi:O-antigen/teichoic acid export membrane protein
LQPPETNTNSCADAHESGPEELDPVLAGQSVVAIRGGAIRVAGYALGVLVSLGTATILVRHLGLTTFGRYVTVTSLVALVGGVTEAGIYAFGIREFALRNEADRRRLLSNLLAMRLALTLMGVAVAVCFALAVGYRHLLVLGTIVTGSALLIQVSADVLSIPLQAQLRLGRLSLVDLARRILVLALIAALASLDAGFLLFLAASAIGGLAALALLARIVGSSITLQLSFDMAAWRELFAETLPFATAVSIGAAYFYVTVVLMSLIATPFQTGLFATSLRVTQVALAVPGLLLTAVFPLMLRGHADLGDVADADSTRAERVNQVFAVALMCGAGMSITMVMGASFVIGVIAGGKAHGAVSVFQIQSLVLTASFVSISSSLALIALRHYRTMLIATSCALAVNIMLGLLLIPLLGARGGAIADVVTEAGVAIGLTYALVRTLSGRRLDTAFVPSLLLACVLALAVWPLPVSSLVHAMAGAVIYLGVLLVMGAIPTEVMAAARRLRTMRTAV